MVRTFAVVMVVALACMVCPRVARFGAAPAWAAPPAGEETRALWVVRHAISTPGRVDAVVDLAEQMNINTLLVQVRGRGDAFYKSGAGGFGIFIVPSLDLVIYKLGGMDSQYDPALTGLAQPFAYDGSRDNWQPIPRTPFHEGSMGGDDGLERDLCHGRAHDVCVGLAVGRANDGGAVPAIRCKPQDRVQVD